MITWIYIITSIACIILGFKLAIWFMSVKMTFTVERMMAEEKEKVTQQVAKNYQAAREIHGQMKYISEKLLEAKTAKDISNLVASLKAVDFKRIDEEYR